MAILLRVLSFRGRIGRGVWRVAVLAATLSVAYLVVAVFALEMWLSSRDAADLSWPDFDGLPVATTLGLLGLVIWLWLVAATSVRRLHDTNLTGWWLLVVSFPWAGLVALISWLGLFPARPAAGIANRYGSRRA